MLLKQMKYFQAVVEKNSFTEAAEVFQISQSAISQQIRAMEEELGFPLVIRKNRSFEVTPAGRYFYEKSLEITALSEKACKESRKIARNEHASLRLGTGRRAQGYAVQRALGEFRKRYPKAEISIETGSGRNLLKGLQKKKFDLILTDDSCVLNKDMDKAVLSSRQWYIELPAGKKYDPEASLSEPCIVTSAEDREYFRTVLGFKGSFPAADNLDEARMMVLAGKGILPVESSCEKMPGGLIERVPLLKGGVQPSLTILAIWNRENTNEAVGEFTEILCGQVW